MVISIQDYAVSRTSLLIFRLIELQEIVEHPFDLGLFSHTINVKIRDILSRSNKSF